MHPAAQLPQQPQQLPHGWQEAVESTWLSCSASAVAAAAASESVTVRIVSSTDEYV
jgi:hypothetical protein